MNKISDGVMPYSGMPVDIPVRSTKRTMSGRLKICELLEHHIY